jgi:Ca2+-binding RTX toxin-like protein
LKGIDEIDGGAGNDTIIGTDGNDVIEGNQGDDSLSGGKGDDTFKVYGNAGFDKVDGGDGHDTIQGSQYNDTIQVATNFENIQNIETIDGGDGYDTLQAGSGDDVLDLSRGPALKGIDEIDGGAGNDTIIGTDGNDNIDGNRGDDTLAGGRGDDHLDGGAGNDTLVLSGSREEYKITQNSDSSFSISDTVADRDGTDSIENFEKVQFGEQTLSVDELMNPVAEDDGLLEAFSGEDLFYAMDSGFGDDAGMGWAESVQVEDSAAQSADQGPWGSFMEAGPDDVDLAASALDLAPDTSGALNLTEGANDGMESIDRLHG